MNPQESHALTKFMRKLRDELKLTILLIEHDMKVVMGVSGVWDKFVGSKISLPV